MKKLFVFMFILSSMVLTGCSSSDEREASDEVTTVSSAPQSSAIDDANPRDMQVRTRSMDPALFSESKVIEKVQSELNSRGYSAGSEDGLFGRNTSKALTRFQRHEGLDANGRINAETIRAMNLENFVSEETTEEYSE